MRAFDWLHELLTRAWPRPERKGRWNPDSLVPHLAVKRLEERRVLNADAAPVEVLVVDAGPSANDAQADTFQVEQDGDQVRVLVNGEQSYSGRADALSAIEVRGSADNDVLVADLLAGVSLSFDAGGGDDLLRVHGDGQFDHAGYEFGGAGEAEIVAQSDRGEASVTIRGVERVADSLRARERTFTLSGDARDVTLSASEGDEPGASRLSVDGAQPLVVEFTNPTRSLTLDTSASGGEEGDRVAVDGVGVGFNSDLTVTGDARDRLEIRGAVDLGAGDMLVSTGAVVLAESVTSSGASFDFHAHASIDVQERGVIDNDGGRVRVEAPDIQLDGAATAAGGVVELDSGDDGVTLVSGVIDVSQTALGEQGGVVHVLGASVVVVAGARINASGSGGGGMILVGGDYQGKNPGVRNASRTYVGSHASLKAGADWKGDGGRVIVWADEGTRFYGSISARGGVEGGDGGFAEVSGKESLVKKGSVDLSAPNGETGTLLLDPLRIVIQGGTGDGDDSNGGGSALQDANAGESNTAGTIELGDTDDGGGGGGDGAEPFVITEEEIEDQSATANIILQAQDEVSVQGDFDHQADGEGDGVVLIQDGNSLTIQTRNDAGDLATGIDLTGAGPLEFRTVNAVGGPTGDITVETGVLGAVAPQAAPISVGALTTGSPSGTGDQTSGSITINATGAITIDGAITTGDATSTDASATSGDVSITSGAAITGAGSVMTGDASGDGAAGNQAVTSGTITLDASGALSLSAAEALATGDAVIANDNNASDSATVGDIVISDANKVSSDGGTGALDVAIGTTTTAGNAAAEEGQLSVTTDGGAANAGGIFITSGSALRLGVLDTGGAAQNVAVTVSGGAALTVAEASNLDNDVVTLSADEIDVQDAGADGAAGATLTAGTISVQPATAATDIDLGTETAGSLSLLDAELDELDATTLRVGSAAAGAISIAAALTPANITNLVLLSGDNLSQTAGSTLTVSGLGLVIAGDTTLGLANDVDTLAADNEGTILYNDANTLTVGEITAPGMANITGVTTSGDDVKLTVAGLMIDEEIALGAGDLGIVSSAAVTQTAAISGAGLLLMGAGPFTLAHTDNDFAELAADTTLTVNYRDDDGLTIGEVTVLDGTADEMTEAGVTTTDDDVKLTVDANDLAINEDINVGAAELLLAAGGDVTQQAGDTITARGLGLMVGGATTLTEAANNVMVLAADNDGPLNYTDADTLTVGEVVVLDGAPDEMTVTGLATSGDDVKLTVAANNLNIDEDVNLGAGDLLLGVAGDVSQQAGDTITARGLGLMAGGAATLTDPGNDVTVLAASTGGLFNYTDSDDLTVGEVVVLDGTADEMTVTGLTTSDDDAKLTLGGLEVDEAIDVGMGDLAIVSSAPVTQTAAIEGAGLLLMGAGPFTLTRPTNDFTTIAASTTGAISYTDADDLTVGTVTVFDATAAQMQLTAITTTGAAVSLRLVGVDALLTVPDNLVAFDGISTTGGPVTLTADNIDLGVLNAAQLAVDAGAGLVTLRPDSAAAAIQVGAGAADSAGQLGLTDVELADVATAGGVTIGAATGDGGVTVVGTTDLVTPGNLTGGVLTLLQDMGDITVNFTVTSPVDTALRTTSGDVVFGAAGAVSATSNDVALSAVGGSVQGNAAALTNVTASALIVRADDGVGSAAAPLETDVVSLDLVNSASGDVLIDELSALDIFQLDQNAPAGAVDVDANGTITVVAGQMGASVVNGQLTLRANGQDSNIAVNDTVSSSGGAITLLAANDATFAATGSITSTSGDVTVRADADGAVDSGGVFRGELFMVNGAVINAGTGAIDLDANENVSLGRVVTTNNSLTAVAVTSLAGAVVDNGDMGGEDIDASAGVVTISAAAGIGAGTGELDEAAAIDIDAGTLHATNTTAGAIQVLETNNVALGAINNANRDVVLDAGGAMTDGAAAATNITAGDAILRAGAGIAASGAAIDTAITRFEADGGTGGLFATNHGAVEIADISAVIVGASADDDVAIDTLGGDLVANQTVASTGGSIDLHAFEDLHANASVTTAAGAIGVSANSNVMFGATGVINTSSGGVSVTADADSDANGAIIDAGDASIDIAAGASAVMLSAATGIGAGTGELGEAAAIDVNAGTLHATNTTAGAIQVLETSSVALGEIDNANRDVVLDAGGAMTDGNGAALNVTAGDAILRAATGIGASGAPMDTSMARLEAAGGTGGLFITNFGAIQIADVSAVIIGASAGGDISIETTTDGVGATSDDLTVAQPVLSATASITLDAADNAVINHNVTARTRIDITAQRDAINAFQFNAGLLTAMAGTPDQASIGPVLFQLDATGTRFTALDMSNDMTVQPLSTGGTALIQVFANEAVPASTYQIEIDWREAEGDVSQEEPFPEPTMPPGIPDPTPVAVAPDPTAVDAEDKEVQVNSSVLNPTTPQGQYEHVYFADPDPTDPSILFVVVRISQFAGGMIDIELGPNDVDLQDFVQDPATLVDTAGNPVALNETFDTQVGIMSVITVPVLQLPGAFFTPLPDPLPITPPQPAAPPLVTPPPAEPVVIQTDPPQLPSSAGYTGSAEERYYELRIVSIDREGNLQEATDQIINLSDEELKAIAPFDPSKLPELFRRLPGDRYRLYLIEDGAARLVIEFVIERVGDEGRPVELPARPEAEEAPAGETPEAPPAAGDQQPEARLERAPALEGRPPAQESFADGLHGASFVSTGGVIFGAAALSRPAQRRREREADRRMARFRRGARSRTPGGAERTREAWPPQPSADC